jgi:ATP-dependent Lon protease
MLTDGGWNYGNAGSITISGGQDSGIKTVFIPKDNEKDLAEIPDNVKKGLKIFAVSHVDEVIAKALVRPPVAIEWVEPEEVAAVTATGESVAVRPH